MPSQITLIPIFLLFNPSNFTFTFVSNNILMGNPDFFLRLDFKVVTDSASSNWEVVKRVECIIVMLFGVEMKDGKDPFAIWIWFERVVINMGSKV